jgi:transposase-like protein
MLNTMKICNQCKKEKRIEDFQIRKASIDGMTARCKSCLSAYDKKRADLPHRVKARLDYAKTDKGKEAGNKAKIKFLKRNPIKRMASIMVGNAVRDGKLIKPDSCEDCGTTPIRLHGHHYDYAYPLVVRWLCPGCHNKWHKLNGEGLNGS